MGRRVWFWNMIAKKYASDPVGDQASYERKLAETQALFTPESEVLEIACGTGTTSLIHAPFVKHIRATDFSEKMIAIANGKKGDVTNVDFEVGDIDDLTVPDASVDVVMAHSILHLLDNPERVINQIYRMLKPGGYFVSSTVCIGDDSKLWIPPLWLARTLGVLPTLYFLRADRLAETIRTAGFAPHTRWSPETSSTLFMIAQKPL